MMGIMIHEFDVPVCNSFQAKILNDQLCYEIDLNKFKSEFSIRHLRTGVTFLIDNNEDRQYSWKLHQHQKVEEGKMEYLN